MLLFSLLLLGFFLFLDFLFMVFLLSPLFLKHKFVLLLKFLILCFRIFSFLLSVTNDRAHKISLVFSFYSLDTSTFFDFTIIILIFSFNSFEFFFKEIKSLINIFVRYGAKINYIFNWFLRIMLFKFSFLSSFLFLGLKLILILLCLFLTCNGLLSYLLRRLLCSRLNCFHINCTSVRYLVAP